MAYLGLSAYAAMHPRFPREQYMRTIVNSPAPAMAVLWGSFGEEEDLLETFCNTFKDRPHLIEIHYANEVGRRNNRLGKGEMFPKLTAAAYNKALENVNNPRNIAAKKVLIQRAKNISRLLTAISNSHTNAVISTGLEDNYTDAAFQNVYGIIRTVWPGAICRNPVGTNRQNTITPATIAEFHGEGRVRGTCIINEDGVSHSSGETRKWIQSRRGAFALFIWRASHQGYNFKRFVTPMNRTFTISERDVKDIGALLKL